MTLVYTNAHHYLLESQLSLHSLAFNNSMKAATFIHGLAMIQKP